VRVFLAGATGAIGRRLVPLLQEAGYPVTGMTRSEARAGALRAHGIDAVVADAFDADAVREAVVAARPDVVIHQLTDIPRVIDPRRYEEQMAGNDRLRDEGTPNLVAAARAAGARRVVAQSIAFAYAPQGTDTPRTEGDPLFLDAPRAYARSVRSIAALERTVMEEEALEGVVLRYGFFYGPGTAYSKRSATAETLRKRRFPIVGGGSGVWSWINIDDAANAAVCALDAPPGIYNVIDDEPAPVREWLPVLAESLGAPEPRRVPAWLARFGAGRLGVYYMTRLEGASNEKARRELGWQPVVTSWRDGFFTSMS